jgi:hypothetical protein
VPGNLVKALRLRNDAHHLLSHPGPCLPASRARSRRKLAATGMA